MKDKFISLIQNTGFWIKLFAFMSMIDLIIAYIVSGSGSLDVKFSGIEFSIWLAAELIYKKKEKK